MIQNQFINLRERLLNQPTLKNIAQIIAHVKTILAKKNDELTDDDVLYLYTVREYAGYLSRKDKPNLPESLMYLGNYESVLGLISSKLDNVNIDLDRKAKIDQEFSVIKNYDYKRTYTLVVNTVYATETPTLDELRSVLPALQAVKKNPEDLTDNDYLALFAADVLKSRWQSFDASKQSAGFKGYLIELMKADFRNSLAGVTDKSKQALNEFNAIREQHNQGTSDISTSHNRDDHIQQKYLAYIGIASLEEQDKQQVVNVKTFLSESKSETGQTNKVETVGKPAVQVGTTTSDAPFSPKLSREAYDRIEFLHQTKSPNQIAINELTSAAFNVLNKDKNELSEEDVLLLITIQKTAEKWTGASISSETGFFKFKNALVKDKIVPVIESLKEDQRYQAALVEFDNAQTAVGNRSMTFAKYSGQEIQFKSDDASVTHYDAKKGIKITEDYTPTPAKTMEELKREELITNLQKYIDDIKNKSIEYGKEAVSIEHLNIKMNKSDAAYPNKYSKTNLSHGFSYFKKAQAANRLINVLLAEQLIQELKGDKTIDDVFSNIKDKRNGLVQKTGIGRGTIHFGTGIRSTTLNNIIADAHVYCKTHKPTPKPR